MKRSFATASTCKAGILQHLAPLLCATLLFLPGCSSFNRRYLSADTPPAGQSLVYFYRPLHASGDGPDPRILQDGKEIIARLPPKTYWTVAIPPGLYTFNASFPMYGSGSLTIDNQQADDLFFVAVRYEYGAPDHFELYLAGRGEDSEPKALAGCFRTEQ